MKMTNKFERVHGKGGLGVVYLGVLKKQQVAVKMLNRESIYDIQQFTAEVRDFVKVHHKNLVTLIGYCDDGEHLALIYEFVANGDLSDHLSGKFGNVLTQLLNAFRSAANGDTLEMVDSRLNNNFEPNSVMKAMEVARACAARASNRPSISQVVIELNECLALEMARAHGTTR